MPNMLIVGKTVCLCIYIPKRLHHIYSLYYRILFKFKVLRLRFNKDQRVDEVRKLLDSSEPVTIAITQRPEVSDHEFIEEQERHLYAICTRTMALSVGR